MKELKPLKALALLLICIVPIIASANNEPGNEKKTASELKQKLKDRAPEIKKRIIDRRAARRANKAPIDGGITLLLAAGVAFGAKKLYDNKNKASEAGI